MQTESGAYQQTVMPIWFHSWPIFWNQTKLKKKIITKWDAVLVCRENASQNIASQRPTDQVWGKNQPHPYHVMQNVEERTCRSRNRNSSSGRRNECPRMDLQVHCGLPSPCYVSSRESIGLRNCQALSHKGHLVPGKAALCFIRFNRQ